MFSFVNEMMFFVVFSSSSSSSWKRAKNKNIAHTTKCDGFELWQQSSNFVRNDDVDDNSHEISVGVPIFSIFRGHSLAWSFDYGFNKCAQSRKLNARIDSAKKNWINKQTYTWLVFLICFLFILSFSYYYCCDFVYVWIIKSPIYKRLSFFSLSFGSWANSML